MVLAYNSKTLTVTGSLEIDATFSLTCDQAGSFESAQAKTVEKKQTGYGQVLSVDALVNTTSEGSLTFSYNTKWTKIELGMVDLDGKDPQAYCNNCIPSSSKFGAVTSKVFTSQPDFQISLFPSFWSDGIAG
jgi:hypothetical protein